MAHMYSPGQLNRTPSLTLSSESPPVVTFYKKKPDARTLPTFRDPGQTPISQFMRRQFTENHSPFGRQTQAQSSPAAPPMTSRQAKQAAKERYSSRPKMTDEQLRASLKKEEERRREQETQERLMRVRQASKARNKIKAKEKLKLKLEKERGKQKEGQAALTKFGFLPGKKSNEVIKEAGRCLSCPGLKQKDSL